MSLLHAAPSARPTERCGICNRAIQPDSPRVALFGKVGDHCKTKHAALSTTLEQQGLGDFLTGPVEFEPVASEDAGGVSAWDFPVHIERMRRRAITLGFRFEWYWPRQAGPATCQLFMPRNDKLRRRLVGKLERLGAAA